LLQSLFVANCGSVFVDLRIGLNNVGEKPREFILDYAKRFVRKGISTVVYEPDWQGGDSYKYPVQRAMFRDPTNAAHEYFVWFDDDSYIEQDFFMDLAKQLKRGNWDIVGVPYIGGLSVPQIKWTMTQPWYTPEIAPPQPRGDFQFAVDFIQGAGICIKQSTALRTNWPWPELRHCGGDVMLGEMARHLNLKVGKFSKGLHVNADYTGKHSTAPRRGFNERDLARNYVGKPLPVDHQDVTIRKWNISVGD
jgi:hypothetical protein